MRFFTSKPTLEARLELAETTYGALVGALREHLALSEEQVTALSTGDVSPIAVAVASLNANFQTQLDAANAATQTAAQSATESQTQLDAATAGATALRDGLRSALQLSDTQFSALNAGDQTVIPAAITALAQRKAVEIAAGQGVPPVLTEPNAGTAEEDEIALAFQTAREEADPRKRGALYAKASALIAKKKTHGKN